MASQMTVNILTNILLIICFWRPREWQYWYNIENQLQIESEILQIAQPKLNIYPYSMYKKYDIKWLKQF